MIDRRQFAEAIAAFGTFPLASAAFAGPFGSTTGLIESLGPQLTKLGKGGAPERLAGNEMFWARVRTAYVLNQNVVNLDHGWTNPTTNAALRALMSGARALESLPAEELGKISLARARQYERHWLKRWAFLQLKSPWSGTPPRR